MKKIWLGIFIIIEGKVRSRSRVQDYIVCFTDVYRLKMKLKIIE